MENQKGNTVGKYKMQMTRVYVPRMNAFSLYVAISAK